MTEPSSPADIGIIIEVSPHDTEKTLYDLGKGGLAQKPDEKQSLWLITDKGTKYIENPALLSETPTRTPTPEPPEEEGAVPSQADHLREIGNRLGVGGRKGSIPLDSIIYYVQRRADMDDLSSVWNT